MAGISVSNTTKAKQARTVTGRNIERIWRREIAGKQPVTAESFAEIAKWVYERIPADDRKRFALDLMEIGSRLPKAKASHG